MRYETNEEIRASIAELTERNRADRIEPPEPFVGETLSFALFEDIRPFRAIFAKYARLVAEGAKPNVDLGKLQKYADTTRLLRYSTDSNVGGFAAGVSLGLWVIERINHGEDVGMSRLSLALTLMGNSDLYYDYLSTESVYDRQSRIQADVQALVDDKERYQADLDAAHVRLVQILKEERGDGE